MNKITTFFVALLSILTAVPTAAQTPNFPQTLPANSVVGRLGVGPGPAQAISFSVLGSRLAPFLNVVGLRAENFGVRCDGLTDNTGSLNAFFQALGNGSGIGGNLGIMPSGTCNFSAALSLPVRNDFGLTGQGTSTELHYVGTSPTINLVTVGDGVSNVSRFTLKDFRITSATTMSSGAALWLRKPFNYKLDGVIVGNGVNGTNKLWNGVWFDGANWGSLINTTVTGLNDSIRANSGVELNLNNVQLVSIGGASAIHVGGGFGGLYLGYVAIFGQNIGLLVNTAFDAAGNNQIFISNQTAIDNTIAAGVYLDDTVSSNKSFTMMGWSASQTSGAGNGIAVVNWKNGTLNLTGAQLISNAGNGMTINDATSRVYIDRSSNISANGNYGVTASGATSLLFSDALPFGNGAGAYGPNVSYATLAQYGVMLGGGAGMPTNAAPLTTGQLLVGATGAAPIALSTGTGITTALGVNVGSAGAPVINGGALGTPSSGVGTNITGLNASNLSAGTVAAARGGAGTITGALKGNGAGAVSQAACADLSNGAAGCSATLPLSVANGGTGDTGTAWSTYTPVVTAGAGTFTSVSASGRYKQLGKIVWFSVSITITTNGTAATSVVFSLPVTTGASNIAIAVGRGIAVSGKMITSTIAQSATTSNIVNYDNTYPGASGETLVVNGTYESI